MNRERLVEILEANGLEAHVTETPKNRLVGIVVSDLFAEDWNINARVARLRKILLSNIDAKDLEGIVSLSPMTRAEYAPLGPK